MIVGVEPTSSIDLLTFKQLANSFRDHFINLFSRLTPKHAMENRPLFGYESGSALFKRQPWPPLVIYNTCVYIESKDQSARVFVYAK